MTKSRKRAVYGGIAVFTLAVAGWGASAYLGSPADIPESRLATVERGTIARSVVATGKIEPITKVEIKSKANGIIKALRVDIDTVVSEGDILAELDKEQLLAQVRGAEATLLAARAALEGAEAQLKKNTVEAEGPDVTFARRAYERAQSLFSQNLIVESALDEAHNAIEVAENRRRAAQSQLYVSQARVSEARAQVAQAKAARLAKSRGVSLLLEQVDMASWAPPPAAFDLVAAIFIQFAGPSLRERIFEGIRRTVKPGGLVLLEGYRPEQLAYGTGGPKMVENLYDEAMLRDAFAGFEVLELRAYDAEINEGAGHSGMSALIDLVARRPD
jgi:hypothetical protein